MQERYQAVTIIGTFCPTFKVICAKTVYIKANEQLKMLIIFFFTKRIHRKQFRRVNIKYRKGETASLYHANKLVQSSQRLINASNS